MTSEPPTWEEPLDVFLHVPKTGGTTLRTLLDAEYAGGVLRMYYRKHGHTLQDVVADLRKMEAPQWDRYRLVMGHFGWGLHYEVPRPVRYFTLARNPIDLLMSQYLHSRRVADAVHHDVAIAHSLTECLRRELVPRWINPLVWHLSDARWQLEMGVRADEPCNEQTLEEATRNVDEFAVIGLTERFDESVAAMRVLLGWGRHPYTTSNVGERPAWRREQDARREVSSRLELDIELYGHISRRFDQLWAANETTFHTALTAARCPRGRRSSRTRCHQ